MQTSSGKELVIRRGELSDLLRQALEHHKKCEAARRSVEGAMDLSLFHAWQAGIRLNKMKAIVGHGNWLDWLSANFKASRQTAELYMRIDNQNPELRELRNPNCQRVSNLKFDSIRKYAIRFVPEKEQMEYEGNFTFPRLVSFLNLINEYNRLKQRHMDGLQLIDFDEVRRECVDLFSKLQFVYGFSETDPWNGQ